MALVGWLAASLVWGGEIPPAGHVDRRIREVDYDPGQVYELTGFYGYEIVIVFSADEAVSHTSAGYADAWDVTSHGHFVTVKPTDRDPDTNLLVFTDRRMYSFSLRAKPPPTEGRIGGAYAADPEQIFVLRFRYPDDEKAAAEAARAQADLQSHLASARSAEERERIRQLANVPAKPINRSYTYQGAHALAPYEAWDDGIFTYFRFYSQQDLPAAFVINEDGSESVANKHFEGDVMVVERVARKFVLRRGHAVVCIWNEGADRYTPEPTTGSTERGGERLLKRR
jgi:type IV secretion system protein VirB9